MKAYAIEGPDTPASLVTLPEPDLGAHDVLVAIGATSINGFDVFQANGYLAAMMEHRYPAVIGRDLAGVVEAIGPEVREFTVGDEVFGFLPPVPPLERGSFAEKLSGSDLVLAPTPTGLDVHAAAALPLAGTAALDLLEALDVKEGDTVLVVGATGGVGTFAVQLANRRGATVIATARPDQEALVRELGATHTIDHTAGNVADLVQELAAGGVTAIIDVVSQRDALTDLASAVRPGRVATALGAADVEHLASRGIAAANVNATPTVAKLRYLGGLVTSGELRVVIDRVYPLEQAGEALAAFQQYKLGKLVLGVGADPAPG